MIGENLRRLRMLKKLSREALGQRLGVSATAVYKWEKDLAEPSIDRLKAMAEIYGVSVSELLGESAPEIGSITVMSRAMRRMTEEEREQVIAVSRALFSRAFGEAEK